MLRLRAFHHTRDRPRRHAARLRAGMGCGASSGDAKFDPDSPTDLTHFKVERMLGEGGFGKVKFVIKKDTKATYAMKCMDKHRILEKRHTLMVHKERSLLIDLSTIEAVPCAAHLARGPSPL